MKVIIAGGREYGSYPELKAYCDAVLEDLNVECILSGTAPWADSLGEQYAIEKGFPLERYSADWNTHGKEAGKIRIRDMAENADMLIAFWDGESGGTGNMISIARQLGLKVFVKAYEAE